MKKNIPSYSRRRGIALFVAVFLLSLTAVGVLMATRSMLDQGQVFERKRDLSRAFYAAEAGTHLVVHWFNHPEDYAPDTALFHYDEETRTFPNLMSALAQGPIVFASDLLPTMADGDSLDIAACEYLEIAPVDSVSAPAAAAGAFASVKSTGVGMRGVRRTVEVFLFEDDLGLNGVDAPLISFQSAGLSGNIQVHWGDIWAHGPIDTMTKNDADKIISHLGGDEWFRMLSEDVLNFQNSWQPRRWYDSSDPQPCDGVDYKGIGDDYGDRMFQHQTLDFPNFDYYEYKELALRRGSYYSTDSSGNIYRNGVEDADHQISSFQDEFYVDVDAEHELVFIDTIDGLPPAADGSNMADLRLSGHSPHTKGLFYICMNLNMRGLGNPPTIGAVDPGGASHNLSKIYHEGLLYVAGTVDSAGNNRVYGSIVTKGGYVGTGTPDIYYDARWSQGPPFPIVSNVRVVLWKTY